MKWSESFAPRLGDTRLPWRGGTKCTRRWGDTRIMDVTHDTRLKTCHNFLVIV